MIVFQLQRDTTSREVERVQREQPSSLYTEIKDLNRSSVDINGAWWI